MRNLFNELFTFRVKENFSAKENFLTEGFAYFLQRDNKVCEAFVERVLGYPVEIAPLAIRLKLGWSRIHVVY